jgi:hypothetical protein
LKHHLNAARFLFDQVKASRVEPSILEFLTEFYVYTQGITSLSTWADDSELGTITHATQTQPLASVNSPGFLLGCAYDIFNFIPHAYDLVQRKRRTLLNSGVPAWLSEFECDIEQDQYEDLHSQISQWQAPVNSSPDFATCGYIYQEALLCYLEMSFLLHPDATQELIESTVSARLQNFGVMLSILPLNAPISATLLWPLMLFGVLTQGVELRDRILQRLAAMWDMLGLGNINATTKFLERFWEDRDNGHAFGSGIGYGLNDVGQIMREYDIDIALA